MFNPLICERCGRQLETDDAISVIEGICQPCRATGRPVNSLAFDDFDLSLNEPETQTPEEPAIRVRQIAPKPAAAGTTRPKTDATRATSPAARPSTREQGPTRAAASAPKTPATAATSFNQPAATESAPRTAPTAPRATTPAQPAAFMRDNTTHSTRQPRTPAPSPAPIPEPAVSFAHPANTQTPSIDPDAEMFTGEDDEEAESLRTLVESAAAAGLYDFSPPVMNEWAASTSSKLGETYRRARTRRQALLAGTALGLLITIGISGYLYFQDRFSRTPVDASILTAAPRQKELALRISPSNARVTIDGYAVGRADDDGRMMVPLPDREPDTLWLEVSAKGYQTLRQPLSNYMGAPEAAIDLVRLPYELTVNAEPADAQIWIDGTFRGTGPVAMTMNPDHPATLLVKADGYFDHEQKLVAPADGEPLNVAVALTQAGAQLLVETDPPGARILVDGELRGASPVTVEFGYEDLGRDIEIAAAAPGYDISRERIQLPQLGGGAVLNARLALVPTTAKLDIDTQPAGGRITIAGRDYGVAPRTIEFDASAVGQEIVLDCSLDGAYFGRQTVSIPPAGDPVRTVITMAFNARKVVFLYSPEGPALNGAMDALAEQIRRLNASQRFAVIAATDEGLETWPGGIEFETATSEQKVRAFDLVRNLRPTVARRYDELFDAARAFGPTTVWLITGSEPSRESLARFSEQLGESDTTLSVVCGLASSEMERFLWTTTSRHRGVGIVLDENASLMAGGADDAVSP